MTPDDLTPSGRRFDGPDATLIELHRDGHVWTALAHRPEFRRPDVVEELLGRAGRFLRDPTVTGVVELDAWWPDRHELVYPTQRCWSLAEILDRARMDREPLGLRAGLELAYVGAQLLQQGAAVGEGGAAPLHGNPSPWRWLFDADGELHLIGWGLPPLELYVQDADPDRVLPTDCYRYCPPERLAARDEDLSTDLFALSLAVVQAIVGEPVYTGTSHEVKQAATRADVPLRLHGWRDRLDEDVRRFLDVALDPYPDGRFDDIADYIQTAHDLLYGPLTDDQPTLAERVARWGSGGPRLPRIPTADAPRWSPPSESRARWEAPRRARPGSRPTRQVDDPEHATRLAARKARASAPLIDDPAAALRDRLGTSRARPAALVDRNGLFPREPLPDDAVRVLVELPDDASTWVRLGPAETLACSAARIADKACPTPFDATGRLQHWFRLEQGDGGWFGDVETRVLDLQAEARLVVVPNRLVTARLYVEGAEEEPLDLSVGTAVHAQFLVSHLRQRLGLRARDWQLWAEETRPLDRWQILDDHDPDDGIVLWLRRARGPRSLRRRS